METITNNLYRDISVLIKDLKKRRCLKCGGVMALDHDEKTGYIRYCLTCGRLEYINISLKCQDPIPGTGVSREGRPTLVLQGKH